MIPLHDNNPTRRFPLVCVVLIALNVLVFILDKTHLVVVREIVQTAYGPRAAEHVIGGLSFRYAMIPALVTGAKAGSPNFPADVQPAWLTIFTSMFLHANWLHLGGNMLYLWIFGNNIEDVLGKWRFLGLYLICGVSAAVLQIASDPSSTIPTVGASGAIAGMMGAYIWLYPSTQILCLVPIFFVFFLEIPAIIVIGYWFLIQFLNAQFLGSGEMLQTHGGVAYYAHVGGFVTGMVLIVILGGRRLLPPPPPRGFDEGYTERRWR